MHRSTTTDLFHTAWLCAACMVCLCPTANADLVDNGRFTTDAVAGLDWLDLTETAGMTMNGALAANQAWRLPTNAEVEVLFEQLFVGYYDTHELGYSSTEQGGYADQLEDVERFLELFGVNLDVPISFTFGVYSDEDAVIRLFGVSNRIGGESTVAGLEHTSNFQSYLESSMNQQIGTLLVRASTAILAPRDIAALPDVSSDAVADVAVLNPAATALSAPVASLLSGRDGSALKQLDFLNQDWHAIRMDTGADADGDSIGDDPFIAVLAVHRDTGKILVQVRAANNGQRISSNLKFGSGNDQAIDVAILDDTNGDGMTDDPSVTVLTENPMSGRQTVHLRSLRTAEVLAEWDITEDDQKLLAIAGIALPGGESRVGVLTVNKVTGKSDIRSIRVADGRELAAQRMLGSTVSPIDLAIQRDGNGDGQVDDPAFVVLAERENGRSMYRKRDVASGTRIDDSMVLNARWQAVRIAVSPDLSGDASPDLLALATNAGHRKIRIKVRDLSSGDSVLNLSPGGP